MHAYAPIKRLLKGPARAVPPPPGVFFGDGFEVALVRPGTQELLHHVGLDGKTLAIGTPGDEYELLVRAPAKAFRARRIIQARRCALAESALGAPAGPGPEHGTL